MRHNRFHKVNTDLMVRRYNSNRFGLQKTNIPADKAFWFFTAITVSFFVSQAIITFFIR